MSSSIAVESEVLDLAIGKLLISGEWRDARSGAHFRVENPATGELLTEVADATAEDALDALAAAAEAQEKWAASAPRVRAEILRAAFERVLERRDELAELTTLEMGKPLAESRGEVAYAAEYLRWFSEEAVRIDGSYLPAPEGNGHLLTTRGPVGPCILITPWNFPLAMATRKIGPALAAGCTMVVKPAQQAPLSMLALAELLEECGLPSGVVNLITSSSASRVIDPLLVDGRARKLSFTGSTQVGRTLIEGSAQTLLRVSMELGGNAPFVVFEDADLEAAVEGAVLAKMRNGGEACTAANRFYVHSSRIEEFESGFAQRLSEMCVGPGIEPGTEVGPLIDADQLAKVSTLVEDAVERGARVVIGGQAMERAGYFYAPTVLSDVPPDCRLLQEEIFGPVAPLVPFEDEAEVVAAANETEYGLVAYIYTSNLDRAMRVSDALEAGMVGVNRGLVSNPAAPFGGIKASGFGREGGREGIGEYLNTKYVALEGAPSS